VDHIQDARRSFDWFSVLGHSLLDQPRRIFHVRCSTSRKSNASVDMRIPSGGSRWSEKDLPILLRVIGTAQSKAGARIRTDHVVETFFRSWVAASCLCVCCESFVTYK
jgi:hypothetical protein